VVAVVQDWLIMQMVAIILVDLAPRDKDFLAEHIMIVKA
jgi:hypothetical protein